MEIFKKRESVTQNIAYMAIMASINILFVLFTNLLPALMFLLVFILPLTSTIVTIYCKKRYYLIYALATLGLCIAVGSGFFLFDALMYVIPSLVVGFLFGLCIELKVPAILIIVGATLLQFAFVILTYLLLEVIVNNFVLANALISLFGLTEFPYVNVFLLVFAYVIAQIQIIFSYLFIKLVSNKIGIEINLECHNRFWLYSITFFTILLGVISYFSFPMWTLVFLIIPLPIYVYEMIQLVLKRKTFIFISLGIIHLSFIFIFAFLYQYVLAPNQLVLIVIITGLVTIIDFLDNYCFIKKSK